MEDQASPFVGVSPSGIPYDSGYCASLLYTEDRIMLKMTSFLLA